MTLTTAHHVDTTAPAVDASGRVVRVGRPYSWRSAHGSRTGRVVRLETHGEPVAVVVSDDTGTELRVRCAGLVALAEGRS